MRLALIGAARRIEAPRLLQRRWLAPTFARRDNSRGVSSRLPLRADLLPAGTLARITSGIVGRHAATQAGNSANGPQP